MSIPAYIPSCEALKLSIKYCRAIPGFAGGTVLLFFSGGIKGFDWSRWRNSNFYAGDWSEMLEIYHFVSYVEY